MNKENLEKIILDKIKRDGIKPKPRFFFVLKNIFFWFLFIFFIVFGALSFALVLYKISGNYEIIKALAETNLNISESLLYMIPYFWVILLAAFLYFAILNYKKTKLSYRVSLLVVILSSLLITVILGVVFFYSGFAQKTDEISAKYLPFYNKYQKIQEVKKKIFIARLKKIGVTKDILENNPELKKQIEDKFDKNVLGKIYLYKKPEACLKDNFKCQSDEIFFEDKKGCGCREIYSDLNFR